MNTTKKNWGRSSKECFSFWKANRRGLTPLQMQKPPGARQLYDGRVSTPSACFRSVQVLPLFRALIAVEHFKLVTRDSRFTQYSDLNFLIPPFPLLLLTKVSFARFVGYFLWLGTVGFGGPIALAGHMQQSAFWSIND